VPDDDLLRSVASAISDGASVDWTAVERSAGSPTARALLRELRAVSALAAEERPGPAARVAADPTRRSALLGVIIALAIVKVALAFAGWFLLQPWAAPPTAALPGPAQPGPALPWPYIINLTVFAGAAAVLFWGGRDDSRARRLGAFFLVIASAFSDRLLAGFTHADLMPTVIIVLRRLPADAFIAYTFWLFVSSFPGPPLRAFDQRVTRVFLQLSLAIGVLLFIANALPLFDTPFHLADMGRALPSPLFTLMRSLDRQSPGDTYYSLLLFGAAVPALPHLLWKSRLDATEERRRAAFFAISLAAGLAPMMLAVIVAPFVEFFNDSTNRAFIGLFLYLGLLSIVPLTAYAVLVHRVIDLRPLITKTLQHALVRYTVWVLSLAPLAYLVFYLYAHRDLTVSEIVSRQKSILLLPLPLLSLVLLTFRNQLLQAVDRRFLGAPPDYPEVLARLERDFRYAHGVREVATVLGREVERAVLPAASAVLVVGESGDELISPTSAVRPLGADSTLGRLLTLAREEIFTGVHASGSVGRLLPEDDRRWLTTHGFQLMVPMVGSGGELLGAIALGAKRGDLPYTKDDRLLLATMAGQAAVIVENRCFRDAGFPSLASGPSRGASAIDWDNEPGAICARCQTMWPSRTPSCDCGGQTTPAAVPLLVRGKFRVLRLIGAGGMSVVYLAIDIALDRKVAIKTLPRLTPDRVLRLQREARAMAAVQHPHLAVIFSVESWRGAPLLLEEYLDGGTLADRLRGGPLPLDEAIALGIVLADVLDRVHASNVLHRDIKPTNIGYTREGAPKLLDFGVASVLGPAEARLVKDPDPLADPVDRLAEAMTRHASAPLTHGDHIVGTPLYLSPEALEGAEPDPSFDLWSLSLVLYEAIAGQHPFQATTVAGVIEHVRHTAIPDIRASRPDTPSSVAQVLARMLHRDPLRRPRTAGELREWLQGLRAERRAPGIARPPRPRT